MIILAIDLGSAHVGWSLHGYNEPAEEHSLRAGTWELVAHRAQDWGMRWVRLERSIKSAVYNMLPDQIAYEHVERHAGTSAAQAYGAALGILRKCAVEQNLPCQPITVSAVKRAATGKGGGPGTDKAAVLAAAQARWPELTFTEDSADSAFVGIAALVELGFPIWTPDPPAKKKRKA